MTTLICLLLLFLGAVACDRCAWLRRHPWGTGLVFGCMGVVADLLAVKIGGWTVLVGFVLPLAASLYFGVAAGLVSGLVVATWSFFACPRILMFGDAVCPVCWAVAAAAVALYAIAVRRWFFGGRRPPPLPAAAVAVFAVVLQKAIENCARADMVAVVVEVAYHVFVPEAANAVAVVVTVALACRAWAGWRANLTSGNAVAMLAFVLGFALLSGFVIERADRQTDEAVMDAQRRLEHDIDDQIGFMLHCSAESIARNLGAAREIPTARMQELAAIFDVDEINLADRRGVIVASSDRLVMTNVLGFAQNEATRPFLALTNGVTRFVKQRFRKSRSNDDVVAKYIGVPCPNADGLVEVGYTRARMEREFEKYFFPMLEDMAFGERGYYLVVDRTTRKVANDAAGHSGIVGKTPEEIGLVRPAGVDGHFDTFDAHVFGRLCRCRDVHVGNWSVYCVVPFADAHGTAVLTAVFGGVLLLLICMVFRVVFYRFTLARAKIDELRAREDARVRKDMEMARTIQLSSLRTDDPETEDFRLRARMIPAREVGGDFYDYSELDDGRLFLAVADVSGKGVPAALFMMQARTILRAGVVRAASVADAVADVNLRLCCHNDAQMFITAWVAAYDLRTGRLTYVNAGHNPPLVRHADGSVEWLRARSGVALGVFEHVRYRAYEATLAPGDTLLLYTDGVTEATDARLELYGEERLKRAFAAAGAETLSAVVADMERFVAGAEQADDVTVMTFDVKRVKGAQAQ